MLNEQLAEHLQRLQLDCAAVQGAVLATREGLILAATGVLDGDTAAATAAHLADVVDAHLSLVADTRCDDLLVWSATAAWYVGRVGTDCVAMVNAQPDCNPGLLRLLARRFAHAVAPLL